MQASGRPSFWRRCRQFAGQQLRQVPCADAVVSSVRCGRRRKYQTLGAEEDGEGCVKDHRQGVSVCFGAAMVRAGALGLFVLLMLGIVRSSRDGEQRLRGSGVEALWLHEYRRDSFILLYAAALELVVCGVCAKTAASMYSKRRHAMKHPQEAPGEQRARYLEVHLAKDVERRGAQLFGLGYRPSTDGLECLLVEDVRPGSLLHRWNASRLPPPPPPAQRMPGGFPDTVAAADPPMERRVLPGAAVVAVNEVAGDIGLMQAELTKAEVTLWVRPDVFHASQWESDFFADGEVGGSGAADASVRPQIVGAERRDVPGRGPPSGGSTGAGDAGEEVETGVAGAAAAAPEPRCAAIALEDEEPQILMRWLVCSLILGWVTILPVLLVQPNEERPRQHLFRQYLLKPCLVVVPVWVIFWILDCAQAVLAVKIMSPLIFFTCCHMLLPAVLVFHMMELQAADEKLVLDQQKTRQAELEQAGSDQQPVALEDPAPAFLRELICLNPIALVILGSVASAPIVVSNLLTPLATDRSRLAQGFINVMYAPCVFFQLAAVLMSGAYQFTDLPKMYLAIFGLIFQLPCFLVWCTCLTCATRYRDQDMMLVESQRAERAREAVGKATGDPDASAGLTSAELVDMKEASQREFELIYSA